MIGAKGEISENYVKKKSISQEQLQCELDYARAQQILCTMLDKGLISLSEFNKVTELNRQSFSPALAQIMPSTR
jgi:predicted transcriptional regulator